MNAASEFHPQWPDRTVSLRIENVLAVRVGRQRSINFLEEPMIRATLTTCLVAALVALLPTLLPAQQLAPPPTLAMVELDYVQQQLKLDDQQKEQVQQAVQQFSQGNQADVQQVQQAGPAQQEQMLAQARQQAMQRAQQFDQQVQKILQPPQVEQLQKITFHVGAFNALMNSSLATQIKLTPQQQQQIQQSVAGLQQEMTRLQQEIFSAQIKAAEQAFAVLTADQQQQLQTLRDEALKAQSAPPAPTAPVPGGAAPGGTAPGGTAPGGAAPGGAGRAPAPGGQSR